MMKHIVVWPIKAGVTDEQKMEMQRRLEGLKETIEALIRIEVGIDDGSGTMALYSEFHSAEGLAVYQDHPAHQEVAAFVRTLVAGRTVCDYRSK